MSGHHHEHVLIIVTCPRRHVEPQHRVCPVKWHLSEPTEWLLWIESKSWHPRLLPDDQRLLDSLRSQSRELLSLALAELMNNSILISLPFFC